MTFGEFHQKLANGELPLKPYHAYYEEVKAAITEAEKEFKNFRIYKPEHRLEYLGKMVDKWFGTEPPAPIKRDANGKPIFKKGLHHEDKLGKPDCFGQPLTQPDCRQCWYLNECTENHLDCFGAPFPTDESMTECQLCPYLDRCCNKALGLEASP